MVQIDEVFLIVIFLDLVEQRNLEFQFTLLRRMTGTAIYAFFVDGDINNSAKVLEFKRSKIQISKGKFI